MKSILVLVEGQTEERFVKEVLQPHLQLHELWLTPTMLRTSAVHRPVRKGGVSSWSRMRRDLLRLVEDSSAVAITTLIDYYGLPADVPGMSTRPPLRSRREQVVHVEGEMHGDLGEPRFRAYLSLHELEALLFSDVGRWASRFDAASIAALKADVGQLEPEDINHGSATAPSKRLAQWLPTYRKTLHGPACARDIGLDLIRERCPHFGAWLSWLESLGGGVQR